MAPESGEKKHSIVIVRPGGGRIFTDFIARVKNRTVGWGGILLIETKHAVGSLDSQIKAVVDHKEYDKALMIFWKDSQDEKRRTVRYDPRTDANVLDEVFRCAAMPTY